MNNDCHPFLKWAGGKRQLIPVIKQYYPFDNGITRYVEPFVGGGAVLFDVLEKYDIKEVYISDINEKLINTYIVIQKYCNLLIKELEKISKEYQSKDTIQQKQYFLDKRTEFNNITNVLKEKKNVKIKQAAYMIFLNRTCFNGLYRVNSDGKFNVSFGSYNNPVICDRDNLILVSKKLQGVVIKCCTYADMLQYIDNQTFVFVDPPYRPLNKTASFNSYSSTGFNDNDQEKLADFVRTIDSIGAKFIVCNSDPHNIDPLDDFFDNLYSGFTINRISATRMINSKATARGTINELLITNI